MLSSSWASRADTTALRATLCLCRRPPTVSPPPRRRAPPAPSALLEDLFADLEYALEAVEFLGQRSRTHTMRSLRVALYRARLDVREASLLRAIMIEVRRYLRRKGLLAEVGPVGARRPPTS